MARGLGQAYKKMNIAVGENNSTDIYMGKKRLVLTFRIQEF